MNIFNYLERVFFGLPTHDSAELLAAKRYRPFSGEPSPNLSYDLHPKELDRFMFGAITPASNADDCLSSKEIEERANAIYELCDK